MKYAVKIGDNGRCETVSWETDACLRREVMDSLWTGSPESCRLFDGMMLVFQHRDSLECVRSGDRDAHTTENAVASELAGFSRVSDDRIYGPAYIVSGQDKMCGVGPKYVADHLTESLLSLTEVAPKRVNRMWSGELAYVDELAPGKGFAYFMYGSENPGTFVGWDREPRQMYAEPPFETLRISVDVVGYIAPGLLLDDRETSVVRMAGSTARWLSSRDGGVSLGTWTTMDDFIETVSRMNDSKVFIEK